MQGLDERIRNIARASVEREAICGRVQHQPVGLHRQRCSGRAEAAQPGRRAHEQVAGVVGEISYVVAQEIQAARCVGVLRHPRPRHPVDGHIALLERDVARRRRRGPPEKRRAHDGDRHSDAGKRIPLDVIDIAERIEPAELDHDGLQARIGRGIHAGKRGQPDGNETRFPENVPVRDGAVRSRF